ncbi:MAG: CoA transferase [Solirubrobacterales bacterium]|nr:CoA transferase [Solirubrobacterales bacterium]
MNPNPESPSVLDGLVVVDFSRVLAGPFATMMLADLGAEVIKIERPGVGDDTRAWRPPQDDRGTSTYFLSVNRNKTSRVIDLQTEKGRAEAWRLMTKADVVVENFRAGLMDELGLGYGDISELNPGLVYCSITGFGNGGGAALPGYDLLVQAVGGLMSITGAEDGGPQKVGVAMVDILAGLFATIGMFAALRHREATGAGQRVDIDLLSSLLSALANQSSAYTAAGVVPGRMGNDHPSIAPYSAYPAADGDLVLAVGNDRQFGDLCGVLGLGLADDDRFSTNENRVANRDALRVELEAVLARETVDTWIERLSAARVPAGRVNGIDRAFQFAESLGLDPTVSLSRTDGSTVTVPANPIGLSLTPPTYRQAPPAEPGSA